MGGHPGSAPGDQGTTRGRMSCPQGSLQTLHWPGFVPEQFHLLVLPFFTSLVDHCTQDCPQGMVSGEVKFSQQGWRGEGEVCGKDMLIPGWW